jgi:ASC-1-like (ASCH) protein
MSETNVQLFPGAFRSTVGGANPGFFLHSDGRVGIGNTAPTTRPVWSSDDNDRNKLNVSGHTHIEGNLNVSGFVYGDGSNMTGVALPWVQSAPNLATDIKYEGGNVGIGGDASATNRLKVHGTVEATSFSGIQVSDVSGLGTFATKNDGNYNIHDPWLRDRDNNSFVKLYGNSRCMVFRTDGSAAYGTNGGYPFIWLYGGDASSKRRMILSNGGQLWLSNYGWLHDKFALKYNGELHDPELHDPELHDPDVYSGLSVYGTVYNINWSDPEHDYWTNGGQIRGDAPGSVNYGLTVQYSIKCEAVSVMSDERIKRDFMEIDDTFALDKLRQLKPTSYRYKDVNRNTNDRVLGFIAQEVAEVLPDAVSISKGVLPNIQLEASVKKIDEEKFEFTLKKPHSVKVGARLEIKAPKLDHMEVEVISVSDDTTFTVLMKKFDIDKVGDRVIVYGEYVDDFHNLDKNAIWTVATAALQEVDRQLQAEKEKVKSLEERLAALEAIVLNQ